MFKVGATFAYSWSKTRTLQRFRALFATVLTQQIGVFAYLCDHEWKKRTNHISQEPIRQPIVWTAAGESGRKRPKTQTSAGKVFASVFWDVQDILFIDYLEKIRSNNSEYYIALLACLKDEIAKNSHKWRNKCSFTKAIHCVTSQSQRCQSYMNCTSNCFRSHPILHILPPPSANWLFADLKRMIQRKRFNSNEEVISETEEYFGAKDK